MEFLVLIPVVLVGLIIVGFVLKNKRLWGISLTFLLVFVIIFLLLTTMETDPGIVREIPN